MAKKKKKSKDPFLKLTEERARELLGDPEDWCNSRVARDGNVEYHIDGSFRLDDIVIYGSRKNYPKKNYEVLFWVEFHTGEFHGYISWHGKEKTKCPDGKVRKLGRMKYGKRVNHSIDIICLNRKKFNYYKVYNYHANRTSVGMKRLYDDGTELSRSITPCRYKKGE